MIRKQLKLFVNTFIVGILIGVSSMVAMAAYRECDYGYYGPVGGYSYKNRATISSSSSSVTASTTVSETGLNNVPANYMGVQPRLYQVGIFCSSYPMDYNSSAANGMGSPISYNCGTGTSFYSYGITAAWNGSSYSTYYTYQSPVINN